MLKQAGRKEYAEFFNDDAIAAAVRKHAAEIRKVFADASPKELRALEATLKKIGKRAESLGTGVDPKCLSQR